jgi:hypothetical protein
MENNNFIQDLTNTRNAIAELHKSVIGLFKPHLLKDYELVVKNDNGHLKCINISRTGYINTLHISSDQGDLFMFKDGKNLTQLEHEEYMEAIGHFDKYKNK